MRPCSVFGFVLQLAFWFLLAVCSPAQTLTTLHSFKFTDGAYPTGLVQATDGNLYGTTGGGGTQQGYGTVFRISPTGVFSTLHKFGGTEGDGPGPLIQASDGNFYGVTVCCFGTIFKVAPTGTVTVLHTFNRTDGTAPSGTLLQAEDGNFYGTTQFGGDFDKGTLFKITSSGVFTVLHHFSGPDGDCPLGSLVQDALGNLYGATKLGGANGDGTVFMASTDGTITTLHSFTLSDGLPYAAVILATDGNLYGTTLAGGTNSDGTIYEVTPSGGFTTLHSFNRTDGAVPQAALVQANDENLYGTAVGGGTNQGCSGGCGTLFRSSFSGTVTPLINFGPGTTGSEFPGAMMQDTNGYFYGVSGGGSGGGGQCSQGCGTIFRFSAGLGAFVAPIPTFASVGTSVRILGTKLTNSSSVTFNGTAATFRVVSPGFIKATVPVGATTGPIQVVTASGTLTSNVPFQVTP